MLCFRRFWPARLHRPLQVASLRLPNRVLLAPLARVSDVPFRRICQELGAGLTYIEMLASNAVLRGHRRTYRTLTRHPSETTLGVQVTGPTADEVAQAVARLSAEGFDTIDINMGCPARKVLRKGWGSAMLRDPERISETVRMARQATSKPLSVKVRLGYCRNTVTIRETARRVAEAGADLLTIHGRVRTDNYGTPVDYRGIRAGVRQAVATAPESICTVGNGDITDRRSALHMTKRTACDAVMISRGALGNPWIFREILSPDYPGTTVDEWLEVVLRHLAYHEEFYGKEKLSAILARKHLLWYVNGFPGVRQVRTRLSVVDDLGEARAALRSYASTLPRTLHRYEHLSPDDLLLQRLPGRDPKAEMNRAADRAAAEDGFEAATGW